MGMDFECIIAIGVLIGPELEGRDELLREIDEKYCGKKGVKKQLSYLSAFDPSDNYLVFVYITSTCIDMPTDQEYKYQKDVYGKLEECADEEDEEEAPECDDADGEDIDEENDDKCSVFYNTEKRKPLKFKHQRNGSALLTVPAPTIQEMKLLMKLLMRYDMSNLKIKARFFHSINV